MGAMKPRAETRAAPAGGEGALRSRAASGEFVVSGCYHLAAAGLYRIRPLAALSSHLLP